MRNLLSALWLVLVAAVAAPVAAQTTLSPNERMALFADFESQLLRERGDLLDREAEMADPIWINGGNGVWLVDGAVMDRRIRTIALLVEDSGLTHALLEDLSPEWGFVFRVWDMFGEDVRATVTSRMVLDPLRERSEAVRRTTLASYDELIGNVRDAFTAALMQRDAPLLPPVLQPYAALGLRHCGCFSTDGRNGTCRDNGCAPPAGYQMRCYWECTDREGNRISVDGVTGEQIRW